MASQTAKRKQTPRGSASWQDQLQQAMQRLEQQREKNPEQLQQRQDPDPL